MSHLSTKGASLKRQKDYLMYSGVEKKSGVGTAGFIRLLIWICLPALMSSRFRSRSGYDGILSYIKHVQRFAMQLAASLDLCIEESKAAVDVLMHQHDANVTFARSDRCASSSWTPCRRSLTQIAASASSSGCASSSPYAFAKARR